MRRLNSLLGLLLLFHLPQIASAHFIWVDVEAPQNSVPQAEVYFGESAEPGEKYLIGKIAHTKAWLRDAAGKLTDVTLKAPADDAKAALTADYAAGPASLEAFCDYGVYSHGGPGVLVQYYAKHLPGEWLNDAKLAPSSKLRLDVIPRTKDGKLAIRVTDNGKPAAEKEVVVFDPAGKRHDLKTNAAGEVQLPNLVAGRYSIRAGNIETDKGGERDGKKYIQTWHYSTLTFDVPTSLAALPAEKPAKQADPSAIAALTRARAGRAVWEQFPGFEADVTVTSAGVESTGHVTIDGNGAVSLDFADSEIATWLEEQLASLVQHRMPDGEVTDGTITWADNDLSHPLGRMINLGDPNLKSMYRLKDDVVMEVNRTAGPEMHFTISVLEIERNAEGKYLPRSFTMNFFDNRTGEVKTSLACLNEWQRVGKYDLPKRFVEINTKAGTSVTRRMDFANAKLLK